MNTGLEVVRPMPGFRLELEFRNGDTTIVDMSQKVKTMRFSRLSSEKTFSTAKAMGDRVVWLDEGRMFGVFCDELMDAAMV